MKIKELKELVIKEATYLRENVTQEEKDNLVLDNFKVYSKFNCIYGLLTGRCNSERACQLYNDSGLKVVFDDILPDGSSITPIKEVLDSSYEASKERGGFITYNFSPMEAYIARYKQDAKRILKFIKGDIDKLTLNGK